MIRAGGTSCIIAGGTDKRVGDPSVDTPAGIPG